MLKKIWQLWWLSVGCLAALFILLVPVQADLSSSALIHDQRQLLSGAQRRQIIRVNQDWQKDRHRPEIRIYTLKHVPADVSDDVEFGTSYGDPVMPFESIGEDLFKNQPNNPEAERVSFIIVYPLRGQLRTIMVPSDDLNQAMSDFQASMLNLNLPSKQGSGASIMAYFNRYRSFVTKHVATVKKIKAGPNWDQVIIVSLITIFALWLLIRKLRHPHAHMTWGTPTDNGFGEGYFWGWFDHDHFGGGGWGPW